MSIQESIALPAVVMFAIQHILEAAMLHQGILGDWAQPGHSVVYGLEKPM